MKQASLPVRVLTSWGGEPDIMQQRDISPRSRLYALEPQALGMLWQESLTSYLNRL